VEWLDSIRKMGVEQRFEKLYNLEFDKAKEVDAFDDTNETDIY
jgi:hypothetical protein